MAATAEVATIITSMEHLEKRLLLSQNNKYKDLCKLLTERHIEILKYLNYLKINLEKYLTQDKGKCLDTNPIDGTNQNGSNIGDDTLQQLNVYLDDKTTFENNIGKYDKQVQQLTESIQSSQAQISDNEESRYKEQLKLLSTTVKPSPSSSTTSSTTSTKSTSRSNVNTTNATNLIIDFFPKFRCDYFNCSQEFASKSHLDAHLSDHHHKLHHHNVNLHHSTVVSHLHHQPENYVTETRQIYVPQVELEVIDYNNDSASPYSASNVDSNKNNIANNIKRGSSSHMSLCDYCGKYFNKHYIEAHKRTHTGDRPFKCSIDGCNRTFTQTSSRNFHEKRFHYSDHRKVNSNCHEQQQFNQMGMMQKHLQHSTLSNSVMMPSIDIAGIHHNKMDDNRHSIRKLKSKLNHTDHRNDISRGRHVCHHCDLQLNTHELEQQLKKEIMPALTSNLFELSIDLDNIECAPDVPYNEIALNRHSSSSSSILTVSEDDHHALVTSKFGSQTLPLPSVGELAKLSRQQAIKITLKITLLDSLTVQWESILFNEELFIRIPSNTSTDNSKEAFIALLEFAEEELYCKNVVVYFDKNKSNRTDELLADLEDDDVDLDDQYATEPNNDFNQLDDSPMDQSTSNSSKQYTSVRSLATLIDSDDLKRVMTEISKRQSNEVMFTKCQIDGPIESHPEYKLVVDANNMAVEIDNDISICNKFVRDKYAKRFPELDSLIPNALDYLMTVKELGNSLDKVKNNENLQFLTQATIMVVSVTASTTQGQQLSEEELNFITDACNIAIEINQCKLKIYQFVESRMAFIAPNLTVITGASIAAKLMGLAGGLTNLSKMPSCNLQSLGSTRKTLAGFSTTSIMPHTGLVYQSEIVQNTAPDFRKNAATYVANKCTLAARIDAAHSYPDGSMGREFRDKIERALDKRQEPPPVKFVKPLPAPIDQPQKRRGGKRVRKLKERLVITDLRKQANRLNFGDIEDDAYQNDLGFTTGQMGKSAHGRIRAPQIDEKTKVRISKTLQKSLQRQNQTFGGTTSVRKHVSGTASTIAFTPKQGLEINNPMAAEKKVNEANAKYFSNTSGFLSVKPKPQ
ncbi:hypothetical protein RDWZM_004367 [Blomia tropicalis]|uniref:U4/U6 small nuclear ribonucleoprotein Prp31 n=1 Tax=Blomia tropicalis TaxID=40697 RepID=A0A9Q0MK73_BLOTA|nr:hypothetical protein RDWZM_004367 [Blomia tropicalis]